MESIEEQWNPPSPPNILSSVLNFTCKYSANISTAITRIPYYTAPKPLL